MLREEPCDAVFGQTDRKTAEATPDRGEVEEGRHNEMLWDDGVVTATC